MVLIGNYDLIESAYHKYDANCPLVFNKIKAIILSRIPHLIVEHTGSTAIGIGGKNIINILAICPTDDYVSSLNELEVFGFQNSLFKNIPKERPLRVGSINYRRKKYLIHIHLTYEGSIDHKRILFFRDYLKKHIKLSKEYVKLKKKAVSAGKVEAAEYNEQKSKFIKSIQSKMK